RSVDDKVTLTKTASEAKSAWRDEERNQAMFGYGDNVQGRDKGDRDTANWSSQANSGTTGTVTGTGATATAGAQAADKTAADRNTSGTY
ncbi:hypothetical protein, partial [Clostridium perfringens]